MTKQQNKKSREAKKSKADKKNPDIVAAVFAEGAATKKTPKK